MDLPHLNLRRRIAALVWVRLLLWVPLVAAVMAWRSGGAFVAAVITGTVLSLALKAWEQSARRQFVREAMMPRFLGAKLRAAYPQLEARDVDLVLRGLRQFFLAHLRSGCKFVSMPSRIVDAAWHEFILHTQGYQRWCTAAFGGLLHHSPAEVLGRDARRNDGLRRTWYWACKEESIDPRHPARLPLLFALDRKFGVVGGFSYVADCKAIDGQSKSSSYCGSEFNDSTAGSGDADGFGGSESPSHASSDGAGDSGSDSGCGGGCGGD